MISLNLKCYYESLSMAPENAMTYFVISEFTLDFPFKIFNMFVF